MKLTYRGKVYNYRSFDIQPNTILAIATKYRGVCSQINSGFIRDAALSPIAFKYRGVSYTRGTTDSQHSISQDRMQPFYRTKSNLTSI